MRRHQPHADLQTTLPPIAPPPPQTFPVATTSNAHYRRFEEPHDIRRAIWQRSIACGTPFVTLRSRGTPLDRGSHLTSEHPSIDYRPPRRMSHSYAGDLNTIPDEGNSSIDLSTIFKHPAGLRTARLIIGDIIRASTDRGSSTIPTFSSVIPQIFGTSMESADKLRDLLAFSDDMQDFGGDMELFAGNSQTTSRFSECKSIKLNKSLQIYYCAIYNNANQRFQ